MNRRTLLSGILGLPFLRWLRPKPDDIVFPIGPGKNNTITSFVVWDEKTGQSWTGSIPNDKIMVSSGQCNWEDPDGVIVKGTFDETGRGNHDRLTGVLQDITITEA